MIKLCIHCFYSFALQALLSNPAVRREINHSHTSTDANMKDFCDATFYKEHPLFKSHPQALYYDDTEVANLLGSKAGVHKLGELTKGVFSAVLGYL